MPVRTMVVAALALIGVAGCGQPPPSPAEQKYVDVQLARHDIPIGLQSDDALLAFGRDVCRRLDDGQPIEDIVLAVFEDRGWVPRREMGVVVTGMVRDAPAAFCPEYVGSPLLTPWWDS